MIRVISFSGMLRDVSGSYDACFKVLAGCLFISAFSFIFAPCARNIERKGTIKAQAMDFLPNQIVRRQSHSSSNL